MKKYIIPMLAVVLFIGSAFVVMNPPVDYKIKDSHSIAFKSKDPSGSFKTITGTVKWDDADLANSKFDLKIPVSSINTGNGMQNKKAQTPEWFDATKYPDIKFVSTKIVKSGDEYKITGKLTMKGVTKEKTIPAKVSKSGSDLTFSGTFSVNRIDYKVGKKSEAVPDVMNITYSLPVAKK
jgi:polyisoprenoid-binding protein YceI